MPKIILDDEIEMLTNYLELEKMRHFGKFDYQIEIDPNLETEVVEIPPLIIQPFAENSILHAFPEKDKKGFLKILFFEKKNHLWGIIEDNGIGIYASQQKKTKKEKQHESMGMNIIARRLELNNPRRKNRLKIVELKNDEGQVLGTKVEIDFGEC